MITRLIYASQSAKGIKPTDIRNILYSSRAYNAVHSITGMLCHGNARFIQYLEGERRIVNALYACLMKDARHRQLVLLDYQSINRRAFKDWSMGFVSIRDAATMTVIKKATGYDEFQPEDLTGDDALHLLRRFKSHLEAQFVVKPGQQIPTRH